MMISRMKPSLLKFLLSLLLSFAFSVFVIVDAGFATTFTNQDQRLDDPTYPEIKLLLIGCKPEMPDHWCAEIPVLRFNVPFVEGTHSIDGIEGKIGAEPFFCSGRRCEVQLEPTPLEGAKLEFGVVTNDNFDRPTYSGWVRVIEVDQVPTLRTNGWIVELASSQYDPPNDQCCYEIWEALPPITNPPLWTTTPLTPEDLATTETFFFLAGRLIRAGYVDARACQNGGIQPNYYANQCGMEAAEELVMDWQNQFDDEIWNAAEYTGVPAWLIKKLFAHESQFWPGNFKEISEFGLGHMTPLGADTLLLWNPDFYKEFCTREYGGASLLCFQGYSTLPADEQADLRYRLATRASAECPSCQNDLDLRNIDFITEIFVQALWANAAQTAQIFWNVTGGPPGVETSYEDLWRLTLVNYNAGPGCLYEAVLETEADKQPITWENVSNHIGEDCEHAIQYVEEITQ